MRKSFKTDALRSIVSRGGPKLWLLAGVAVLVLLNAAALWLYFSPPGGSSADLATQREQLRAEIAAVRASDVRLKTVSGKVQAGSTQADDFEAKYFLPERVAYSAVIAELQRMAKASGVDEREAVFSKEPVEGSDDLTVLNITARFQGSYPNLMKFLHQVDSSPMLLMLDTLQATPQQKGGEIDSQIRFQVIIRENGGAIQ